MRKYTALLAFVLVAACAPKEEAPAADTAAAAPTLADFAGNWQITTIIPASNDTVRSTMAGTADATGWTTTPPGRAPQPLTVSIVGDSLIYQTPEYESVLRKGVQVSTRTALARTGAGLAGTVTATYRMAGGTELVQGNITATRAP